MEQVAVGLCVQFYPEYLGMKRAALRAQHAALKDPQHAALKDREVKKCCGHIIIFFFKAIQAPRQKGFKPAEKTHSAVWDLSKLGWGVQNIN